MSKLKKVFALVLALTLAFSLSISALAAETRVALGIEIRTGNFTGSGDIMLNCYTSGAVVSGTLVSTWSRTGNSSQIWSYYTESNGRLSIRSKANLSVAINANRSYIGTNVNVLTASTNNINDYTFISKPNEYANGSFVMSGRGGHTKNVYLTRSGNANICTWQYYSGGTNQSWQWSET